MKAGNGYDWLSSATKFSHPSNHLSELNCPTLDVCMCVHMCMNLSVCVCVCVCVVVVVVGSLFLNT